MFSITVIEDYFPEFNNFVTHPLQSWQWGEFRKKTGIEVFRFGQFQKNKLQNVYQLTLHKIPKVSFFIGYVPKSALPSYELLSFIQNFFKNKNVIFIKFEPNVERIKNKNLVIGKYKLLESTRPLFTKYTFQIDLTKSEDELSEQMKSKTRYNVRLAQRKGVTVREDNSKESFETYLKLQKETTKRQKFYAHDEKYHRLLWETLHPVKIAYLLNAYYNNEVLVSWIVFLFNNVLYYPYGASSDKYRNLMASNLILWEAMKWGKAHGAKVFDLWGALGPNPSSSDPWYGFHRFKEGYGGRLIEFVGSYDFVINPLLYPIYNLADLIRWKVLRARI